MPMGQNTFTMFYCMWVKIKYQMLLQIPLMSENHQTKKDFSKSSDLPPAYQGKIHQFKKYFQ